MYVSLEIKLPNGHSVGMIESFDGHHIVSYAENEFLRLSLEQLIINGLDTVIPKSKEIIRFNSHPAEPNFLRIVQRYLNISYDYSCEYCQTDTVTDSYKRIRYNYGEIDLTTKVLNVEENDLWGNPKLYKPPVGVMEMESTNFRPITWIKC